MQKKRLFNDGWKFTKQPIGTSLEQIQSKETAWNPVEIPHDWLIYDTNNLYETGEGWYRKIFTLDHIEDQVILINFEGVYQETTVFVNGQIAGEWKYGYSSFEFDISSLVKSGENEIIVRVVHQSPNSRWYSGAGIYRNVWLKIKHPLHILTDGIYISTKKDQDLWKVEIETEVVNDSKTPVKAVIKQTIINSMGDLVLSKEEEIHFDESTKEAKDSLHTGIQNKGHLLTNLQTLSMENPALWSIDHPNLYRLRTEIIMGDQILDVEEQNFGFRTLRFDPNEGFFLNDSYVKLHGVCQHHDLGCLGAAVNKVALRRQLSILKEMGVNAIRTSHNMPAVEFMDLADEMGFLVVSEAFDMWERSKTEFDYARFFPEWHEKDVASWIRRDRNHPSIIMWSIGNEIPDTHASSRGLEVTRILKKLVLTHDPKENGLVTFGSNYLAWENTQICAEELPIVGYNYAEYLYEDHHKKYPHWVIYGSETASTVQSRGVYHFPLSQAMLTNDDEQCSSLGNCTTSWGAKSTSKCIIDDRDAKYCLGQFIWTGFDYIGEPTPYFTKNSYFGQIDTAGFKKDTFYQYQAEWTDYKKNPMVHILPYWDFNQGQLIDVRVYSNAPKVELFLSGRSLGTVEIDHEKGHQLSGDWQIPYQKGTLKAIAYDENNCVIATDEQSSFGDAVSIQLEADKDTLKADGKDLIFVTISTLDEDGHYVANANNRMEVEVTGAGRLIGLDNGDSTDYDQYKGTSKRLFSGKLLAVIASTYEAGEISLRVTSPGLKENSLTLKAIPAEIIPGSSDILMENTKSEMKNEIPIRKIELINHGVNHLNQEIKQTKVTARIYPSNACYDDLTWKVITTSGVETNLASLEIHDREVIITAKGDGNFRLKCMANNQRPRAEIISELEFEVTGLGSASINPYEFVYAGLCNASNYELISGLSHGVSTLLNSPSYIGFRGVDFGEFGSDEITIPIFHLSNEPLPIKIWEGMPDEEGSELLADTYYQADSIWNTYQPNTFKLKRRIKGNTTLCIELNEKVHVHGFQFKKLNKAYERLSIVENTRIFGDSFQLKDDCIEQIGNNVSIEFNHMDFGDQGFSKILICGRSNIDVNTIHIRFHGDHGDINQIVEFPYSKEYVTLEFPLESVLGQQSVNFVFMPGSNFDFQWFQFQ